MSDIPGGDERSTGSATVVGNAAMIGRVQIKVNGISVTVSETVKIREMLEIARNEGAIEGSVEAYVIERVEKEGEIGIEETVTVTEFEEFLAVPTGPTEVA